MKVEIKNVEKSKGMVFKETFLGVELKVLFTEEEKAIVKERDLMRYPILDRPTPANKKEHPAITWELMPALILAGGADTYYMRTETERKQYIDDLKTALADFKAVLDNETTSAEDESFEL